MLRRSDSLRNILLYWQTKSIWAQNIHVYELMVMFHSRNAIFIKLSLHECNILNNLTLHITINHKKIEIKKVLEYCPSHTNLPTYLPTHLTMFYDINVFINEFSNDNAWSLLEYSLVRLLIIMRLEFCFD